MNDSPASFPVTSVTLSYKCFKDTVINNITRITAVVGGPGSGKSTLLGHVMEASPREEEQGDRYGFLSRADEVGGLLREISGKDWDLYVEVSRWVSKILPRVVRVDSWNGLTETWGDGREVRAGSTTIEVTEWIIFLLSDRGTPRVVVFDTDISWHPETEKALIAAVREICVADPALQVVLATNSPYMLDGFAPEEVLVLAQDPEGRSHVRHLSEHPDAERNRTFLGTGEFWTSVGEQWVLV